MSLMMVRAMIYCFTVVPQNKFALVYFTHNFVILINAVQVDWLSWHILGCHCTHYKLVLLWNRPWSREKNIVGSVNFFESVWHFSMKQPIFRRIGPIVKLGHNDVYNNILEYSKLLVTRIFAHTCHVIK